MADSLPRPGVEVVQEFQATSPTILTPTLVPCVVGPAFEIVDITESDGTLNSDSVAGTYEQFPLTLAQTEFPSPRENIDEVDVLEDEVDVYFQMAGTLHQLDNGTDPVNPGGSSSQFGSSFLTASNFASRAALRTATWVAAVGVNLDGLTLNFAIDVVSENDTSQDIAVTFSGTALTAAEVAAVINTAVGEDVATVIDLAPNECVQIASLNYGAGSSVTVRHGSSASNTLFPGAGLPGAWFEGALAGYRVIGSGYRGQDDGDGDLQTPWIEAFRGDYLTHDGTSWTSNGFTLTAAATSAAPGLVDLDDVFTANNNPGAAIEFSGATAEIPLLAATSSSPGDHFYADGIQVNSAEVIEVQQTRFKLGVLNTATSITDDDGNFTTRVYTTAEVGTILSSTPLAPTYAWFKARGLQKNNVDPVGVAATLEGTVSGLAAQAAEVEGIVTSLALSGLTLYLSAKVDGAWVDEVVHTFSSGYATVALLAAALNADTTLNTVYGFEGSTVAGATDMLRIYSLETGADQRVKVGSSGTANTFLGFSTSADTYADGKDVEFATQSVLTGDFIDCGNFAGGEVLEVTVTDHLGTDTLAWTLAGPIADFTALLLALNTTLYPSLMPRVVFSAATAPANVIDQLVITSREGGASVTLATNVNLGTTDVLFGFDDVGPATAADASIDITGLGGTMAAHTITFNVDSLVDPDFGPIVLTEGVEWADAGAGAPAEQTTSDSIVAAIMLDPVLSGVMIAGNSIVAPGTAIPIECLIVPTGEIGNLATLASAGAPAPPVVVTFANGLGPLGEAAGADLIAGETFEFTLDDGCTFSTTLVTNSLDDAIDKINEDVGGFDVASVGTVSARALMLSSLLAGMASSVLVSAGTAATNMGLSTTITYGSGRPDPDFWMDISGNINVGGQIFRNTITGSPDCPISADFYVAYRGLRLDVSPLAVVPGLLTLSDTTVLDTVLGPISEDNPGALGVYLAMVNAPTSSVAFIGVSEVSGTEEYGTPLAYTACAEFLEAHEVYGLAVLTHSPVVHQTFATHVVSMSAAAQKRERIVFICPEVPTESTPTALQSGTGEVYAGTNAFLLAENPGAALTAQGINPATLDEDDDVFLEIEVNGVNRKYLLSAISGVTATLTTTFLSTENLDGFYTTTDLTGPIPDVDYSLKLRGDALLITGSTLPDLDEVADTVAGVASTYQQRRVYYVFPDTCSVDLGGPTLVLPGFYMGCGVVGMIAEQPPQQPFTNLPMSGFSGVSGSNDTFTESQLDAIAGGGVYIVIQDVEGAPLVSRHQLSTNATSIENRELSITKIVDYCAKFMRRGLRDFIGRYNITPAFLDTLGSVIQGQLAFLEENGIILGGTLNNIVQDPDEPDTVIIDVLLNVPYPCNYIRLTLVI